MSVTINGTTGVSLIQDGVIQTADFAAGAVDSTALASSAVTPAKLSQPLTLGTAQNSTSGTSIDFTSIPSWVKRITVMFNGVSTSGTSGIILQLGSGSFTTTGYLGAGTTIGSASGTTVATTNGLPIVPSVVATRVYHGQCTISTISGNNWVSSAVLGDSSGVTSAWGGGSISLSGTLDRIRITTANGTDTFDAGSINIMYE